MTDIKITTRELTKEYKPYGLEQNKKIAKMGGHTAKVARDDLEKNLGKTEITSQNNLNYQYINWFHLNLFSQQLLRHRHLKKLKKCIHLILK